MLTLDASGSRDYSNPYSQLEYTVSCMEMYPQYGGSCQLRIESLSSPVGMYKVTTLSPRSSNTKSLITITVSSGNGMSSQARVEVDVGTTGVQSLALRWNRQKVGAKLLVEV